MSDSRQYQMREMRRIPANPARRFDNRGWQAQVVKGPGAFRGAMQSFIHRKNLENLRKQLAETPDDEKRRLLEKLLSEEEANEPSTSEKRHDE